MHLGRVSLHVVLTWQGDSMVFHPGIGYSIGGHFYWSNDGPLVGIVQEFCWRRAFLLVDDDAFVVAHHDRISVNVCRNIFDVNRHKYWVHIDG